MSNYIWCYVNEKDVSLFDQACIRTPNLFCHNLKLNILCQELNKKNHIHTNLWSTEKTDIQLCHETVYGQHKINVKWHKLYLDEDFADFLIKLVNKAHEIAKKIKQEGTYGERPGAVKATIYSLVHKWSNNPNITIKDMAIDLLYSFAIRHKFYNGNKRTALVACVLFLQSCGLFLRYTNTKENIYMKRWEPMVKNVVKQKHANKKENDIIKYIKRNIDKNVTISYTRYT